MITHVVWDWNGTLLDDFPAVVEAQNALGDVWGLAPMTASQYQDSFRRPLQPYYEELVGRPLTPAEWTRLQDDWMSHYQRLSTTRGLAADALDVLEATTSAGITQSVCSLLRHEHLLTSVTTFDVHARFVSVHGNDGTQHHKDEHLVRHLTEVRTAVGVAHLDAVMIGDTLDDAHAADHAGIECVLVTTGEMPRRRLAATGHPVADSLTDALAIVLELTPDSGSRNRSRPAP